MANEIIIGSLLFDVGLDQAQVQRLTSSIRQAGRDAQQSFERAGKAADPLTQRIQRLNQRVKTLSEQYKAGLVSADQYRQRMDQLREGFERTNRQAGLTQKQMGDLARGMRTATGAVEPLKNTIIRLRATLNDLKGRFEAGTISEKQFTVAARQLRTEIEAARAPLAKNTQQYSQLTNVLGTTTRSINSAEGKMSKLGISAQVGIALNQRMNSSLMAMGPAGHVAAMGISATSGSMGALSVSTVAAVIALGGLGVAAFSLSQRGIPQVKELQQAMAILRASGETDLEAIRDGLDDIRNSGGKAVKVFSRAELAGSLAETVKAGVETADAMVLLATGTQLAAAENEDLTESTALVLKNLRQYRLGVQDAARAGDSLATAGLLAAGTARDLSEGLATVGPVARAAGLSMEETLGILVDLDNNGLDAADRGATGLRSALTSLADPTPKAQAALEGLGVSLVDASGKTRPMIDLLVDLREALGGSEEAMQAAAQIFDTRAITAILALSDATDKYTREIEDGEGALKRYAETMADQNLQAAQDRLDASLDNLSETFSRTFADDIGSAADNMARLIDTIDEAGQNPSFLNALRALQSILGVDLTEFHDETADMTGTPRIGRSSGEGPGIVTAPGMVFGNGGGGDLGAGDPPPGVSVLSFQTAIDQARELEQAILHAADPEAWVAARDALKAWSDESDTNKEALDALREFERRAEAAARDRERAARDAEKAAKDAEKAWKDSQKALQEASLVRPQALVRSQTAEAARGSDQQFMSLPGSVNSSGSVAARLETEKSIREAGERQAQAIVDAYVGGFRAAEGDVNIEALRVLAQNAIRERLRAVDAAIAKSIEDAVMLRAAPQVASQSFGFGGSEASSRSNTGYLSDLGRRAVEAADRQARVDAQTSSQRVNLSQGLRAAERTLELEAEELAEAIRRGRVAIARDTVASQSIGLGAAEARSVGRTGALSDRGVAGIFDAGDRAFNRGVTPFRPRVRRGAGGQISDGGLAEAGEINAARKSLEGVQEQIDKLAGTGPSQFDRLRDAVKDFGLASGKSDDEVAELIGQIDKLEAQAGLVDALNQVSGALSKLGGAASGTPLGDVLTGFGELVGIGTKIASGDYIGAAIDFAAELIAGFTAASEAAQKLKDDVEGVQSGFSLIDTGNLTKTKTEQVGNFFGLPIIGEVFDEAASEFGLSIAEAIEGGVLGGLRSGFDKYMETGDIADLEAGLKEGFRTAIIDAIFEALIEGAIIEGALGDLLTELTEAIAAGDTDAANDAIGRINAIMPELATTVAEYASQIDVPGGSRGSEVTPSVGTDIANNPTGITVPLAPQAAMAAPSFVPEFGGYVADFGQHVGEFGRNIRSMRGNSSIASDLRRNN